MAAPELRLNVSLDLGFFRQQLQKLTVVAQSEFAPQLKVKFDRRTIKAELDNLQRAIKSRVYRIEIGGNIDAFPEKIKSIRQQLAALETSNKIELPVSVKNGVTKKDATSVVAAAYKTIQSSGLEGTGGKIRIPVSIKPAITKADVTTFKKAVKESLGGISVDVKANVKGSGFAGSAQGAAGLMEYMRTQGMIGKTASGMEMRMGNEGGKIQRSALDQLARAVFFMAGIDPARIRAEQAERRRIPNISWQATTPPQSSFGGPSSTGRALPPGAVPMGLPGTAFGSQKRLVGDILSPSLKEAVRGAANTFVDSIRQGINDAVRSVRVRDLGNALRPALAGSRIAGLLPAGVGRSPQTYAGPAQGGPSWVQRASARAEEAYRRSAMREMDVLGGGAGRPPSSYNYAYRAARTQGAIVPYAAGGAMVPSGGGGGGGMGGTYGGPGNFAGGGGGFSGGRFNVPNLPGSGLVREIGEEFGFAAKQVLLFGAAYKGLAFLTGFPAQVGNAVAALQSFNNTLNAISPTAGEVAASNQLILDLVNKYNIPLQSARGGFTKLYASMQSAGFAGDEVRDIFTGITKAAATFGMSADKVDRVNYAFAQMASKGQVMSEELKGQLGDVLPGALGIFAEAAGFKGPDAIQKFSKALEDGAYKGEAMKQLLTNVGIVMNQEFGPGAEGAARTFQGVINRMQNSLTLLYESFEPVAVGFLNSVVMPMTSGLKTVTDGFNAFFTGQAAQTTGGSAFAKQLEALRPAFEGIATNIKQILPLLQSFASTALSLGQVLLQIAGNPFAGYLARIYLSVLPLTIALRVLNLQVLVPLVGSFLRAIPAFVSFNAAMASGVGTNKALQLSMQLTGQAAGVTAGRIRLISAALATLGTTAIFAGIGLLIERFLMMKSAIDGVRQSTQQMLGSISSMANSGAVKELQNVGKDLQKQRETFESLKPFVSGGTGGTPQRRLTESAAKRLEELGMGSFVGRGVTGPYVTDFLRASKIIEERLKGINKQSAGVAEKMPLAIKAASDLAKQAGAAQAIAPIPGTPGDGTGKAKPAKEQSLEGYYSLQDQLAKNFTQDQIDRMEKEYQARVDRINAEFDLREARANSFQKEAIRYERQIAAIELKRQKALLDASNEVIKAQGSVAGGAGMTMGGIVAMTGGALSQDALTRGRSTGAHLHAQAAGVTEKTLRYLVDKYLEVGGKTASAFGQSRGSVGHGYNAIDFLTPQGTPIKLREGASIGQYGPAGGRGGLMAQVTTPEGNFQLGHLSSLASQAQAGIARKVTGSEKRDVVAEQKTQLAIAQKSLAVQIAEAQAIRDAAVAWAEYTNAITPIEEQKLQNSLLTKKNELVKSGLPDDVIEKEMKQFETQQKTAIAIGIVNKQRADGLIGKDEEVKRIAELNENMAIYNGLLADSLTLQNQQKFDESMGALRKQLEIAGIIDPRAELRARIRQEKPGYSEGQVEEEAAMQERIGQLETAKERIKGVAGAIGDAFGEAFKGIVTGSMTAQEALAGMFQSIADHFADMVAQMIAEWLKAQLIQGFMNIFSSLIPGVGSLGGGGSVLGGNSSAVFGINSADMNQYAPLLPMANGGVLSGGFRAFANGGIVTGPTLGLVGEGRYNEAVIPLPDGRSVPVELSGGGSSSPTVIVNVDAKGSQVEGDEQNANQLGRVISAAVQTELIKQQRPGGLLASRR